MSCLLLLQPSPVKRVKWTFLAALALSLGSCGGDATEEQTSAILITFDTTRIDVLSPFGGPASVTPNMTRLAAESLLFREASTVAPLTLPAHASMLTGLYPPRHGLRENGIASLPPSARTLAEAAQSEGFQTAAFVAAVVLDASFGLDQGFDTYVGPDRAGTSNTSHTSELPADVVVDRALEWLRKRDQDRPFFLWVHFFDPHGPYLPPAPFRPADTDDVPAMYLGEVRFADAQLGRLLEGMRAAGILDETTVALAADHGEAFGEHGEPTHGAYVWETTMRVPLLLRDPAGRRAGESVNDTVSVADLHPTLWHAMGLERPPVVDGLDLMPLFDGGSLPADRGVYFESYSGYLSYGWSHLAGWRDARGKYIHSSSPQFFEISSDPREQTNLIPAGAIDRERLQHYQRALAELGQQPALEQATGEAAGEGTSAEMLEQIRGLGYTGMGGSTEGLPKPLEASTLPAPQDYVEVYSSALQAQELMNEGRLEEAEQIFLGMWNDQPNNPFVLDRFGSVLLRLSKPDQAIPVFERLLKIGPGWAGSACNLGLAYGQVGRIDEAIEQLEKALTRDPDEPFFWDTLLRLLEENGRDEELAEWRAKRAARKS
ncbi:MAG: choline-sulfatase [Planctomycetota bacterium]|jgi:choline-sulfatase